MSIEDEKKYSIARKKVALTPTALAELGYKGDTLISCLYLTFIRTSSRRNGIDIEKLMLCLRK